MSDRRTVEVRVGSAEALGFENLPRMKLEQRIANKCPVEVSGPVAASIYAAAGRSDPACFDRSVTAPADAVDAIACSFRASVDCTDQLGIGESPALCNPNCGNGVIESGETCDDSNQLNDNGLGSLDTCPSNCAVAARTDAGTDAAIRVDFDTPGDVALVGLTVVLTYDESKVSIPSSGFGASIDGALASPSFALTTGDTDTALRIIAVDPFLFTVPPGEAFTVTFDRCQGAMAPTAAEFGCMVVEAVKLAEDLVTSVAVDGATCSVTVL